MKCFVALLLIPLLGQPDIHGSWLLKSVKVNGQPASGKQLAGLLRNHGELAGEMIYTFREPGPDGDADCVLNDVEFEYLHDARTREVKALAFDKAGKCHALLFHYQFVGDDLKLRCKDQGKTVEMVFKKEQ